MNNNAMTPRETQKLALSLMYGMSHQEPVKEERLIAWLEWVQDVKLQNSLIELAEKGLAVACWGEEEGDWLFRKTTNEERDRILKDFEKIDQAK
jgi:hypothetical protein